MSKKQILISSKNKKKTSTFESYTIFFLSLYQEIFIQRMLINKIFWFRYFLIVKNNSSFKILLKNFQIQLNELTTQFLRKLIKIHVRNNSHLIFRYVHGCLQSCNDADACNAAIPTKHIDWITALLFVTCLFIQNFS